MRTPWGQPAPNYQCHLSGGAGLVCDGPWYVKVVRLGANLSVSFSSALGRLEYLWDSHYTPYVQKCVRQSKADIGVTSVQDVATFRHVQHHSDETLSPLTFHVAVGVE